MKFLVVNASAYHPSITAGFCDIFEQNCSRCGIDTKRLNLFIDTPPINPGHYQHPDDYTITEFQKMVLESDGMFIATPCHWFNVPGVLKNLIDHLTCIETDLWQKSRPLCVVVHAPEGGEYGALSSIILPLNLMGFAIPASGYAYYNGGDKWAYDDIPEMPQRMKDAILHKK